MTLDLGREIERRKKLARDLSESDLKMLSKIVKSSVNDLDVFRYSNGRNQPYEYVHFPVSVGGVSQELFEAIGLLFAWHSSQNRYADEADALFTESDYGGGQILTATGSYTGLESCWANQYAQDIMQGVPGITAITAKAGYRAEVNVGVSNMDEIQKVIVVDDILSTGGTFKDLLSCIGEMGVHALAFYSVIEKLDFGGRNHINQTHPELPIITLAQTQHNIYVDHEERFRAGQPVGIANVVDDERIFYE
ncbi:hypothetical protein ACFL0V_01030 [Nanoarchaeota archaeon]